MTAPLAARSALAALALVAAALAGCTGAPQASPEPPAGVAVVAERPAATFGDVATGPASGPDPDATTAAPPRLVSGEWWRIRFASPQGVYAATEVVRVVAAVEGEGYLVGMPHSGWFKEAIAYHAPAFGDVGFDLSYEVHNHLFEPLRFPLVQGASWETQFANQRFVATVESADEHTAVVRFALPPREPRPTDPVYGALGMGRFDGLRMTYDARQHEVVKFESFIGSWEVVEHGYGFEGWVTIPRGAQTVIDHGQFLPATPGQPVLRRAAEVDGGFNRLTLLQYIAALTPGAYRVRAVAPDGTEFATELVGGSDEVFQFHEAANPGGPWQLEDLVGGAGATYSMGIAYHQYDIRLPHGARRADHSHDVVR